MSDFPDLLKKARAFLLAIVLALTSLSFGNNIFIKKDPGVLLTAAFMSDTHVGDVFYRRMVFVPGVRDVSRHVKPDVFIVTGDCTDNGSDENWLAFQSILQKNLRADNTILTIGNHDTWVSYDTDHEYEIAKNNFLRYANEIMGTAESEVYFTRFIGGYPFIVLGSEDSTTSCVMTHAQLDWLETALAQAAAAAQGKPIFVLNHQPMNFTHTVGSNEHSNGFSSDETSARLQAILDNYENIFYFSGHQHYPLQLSRPDEDEAFATVEKVGRHITSVNLPCYEYGTFLEGGTSVLGQGVVMYVFSDRVQFKGRNYFLSNWDKHFDVTIPLV